MHRKTRRNLALLAMIVVLGLLIAAQLGAEREDAADRTLWSPDTPVTTIAVECRQCEARSFERIDGHWWMRQPYPLPADEEAVQRLLAVAQQPVTWRDAGVLSLAALGLEPAHAHLRLDAMEIAFGGTDAIDGLRYTRVGERIGRMADHVIYRLQVPPLAELDHRLVAADMALSGVRVGHVDRADVMPLWTRLRATQIVARKDAETASFPVTLHFEGHADAHLALDAHADIIWRQHPAVGYVVAAQDMAILRNAHAGEGS